MQYPLYRLQRLACLARFSSFNRRLDKDTNHCAVHNTENANIYDMLGVNWFLDFPSRMHDTSYERSSTDY